MSSRPVALALVAAFAAAATWWACSGEQSSTPAKGGADGGGTGALGGTSGGTNGGGGSGGKAGSGGTTDSGAWGESPIWKGISGTAIGCAFERMTNADKVRFFKWQPCSWTDGCEQAVFNEGVFGKDATFIRTSVVVDDGTTVRAGLTIWTPKQMAAFAGDEGMGLDAFRVTGTVSCRLEAVSLWGSRFAIELSALNYDKFGGILGDIGAMAAEPVLFDIAAPPPGGPQQYILGSDRWMWWWTPGDRLTTVSGKDGSGFQIFTQVSGPILHYSGLATTGSLFLMQEFEIQDGGSVQAKIAYSDGASPTKSYLVPDDPNDDYGSPTFANSHVGFMKGVSRKQPYTYDHAEIWATPYSTNPSELKPEVVGSYAYPSIGLLVGGWGRVATIEGAVGGPLDLAIWTISTKSVRRYSLPVDHFPDPMLGVTRTHLWDGATKLNVGSDPYLMRFKVE